MGLKLHQDDQTLIQIRRQLFGYRSRKVLPRKRKQHKMILRLQTIASFRYYAQVEFRGPPTHGSAYAKV